MTAYIDLDIVLYRCLFATKDQNYYAQLRACDNTLQNILDNLQPDDYDLVLTGPGNFRYQIYKDYKANRKDMVRPEYLHDAKEYFCKYWGATLTRGIESDDHIAMNYREGDIIASTDKDFLQLPAIIHNWVKGETFVVQNPWYHFCVQLLIGDDADNVDGVPNPKKKHYTSPPNFTEKTAGEILQGKSPSEMKAIVLDLYQQVYGDEWFQKFDMNCRLLWLQRKDSIEYYNEWNKL